MAKKTVASLHDGSKEGRAYTKVIKMVKSPKTVSRWLRLRRPVLTSSMNKWFLTKKYRTFSRNKINAVAVRR